MYKQIKNILDESAPVQMVKRLSDNAFIPFDTENKDYQEYLEWVAEGNTPEEAE